MKWVTIQSTAKQLQITTSSNHCHVHNVVFWQESCNDKKYIFWYKKQHKSGAARKKLERGYIYIFPCKQQQTNLKNQKITSLFSEGRNEMNE